MQRKILGICCAFALSLSCVSFLPEKVSAAETASYSDFIAYLESTDIYKSAKHDYWSFLYVLNPSNPKQSILYAIGGGSYTSSVTSGYVRFSDNKFGVRIVCNGSTDENGFIFSITTSNYDTMYMSNYKGYLVMGPVGAVSGSYVAFYPLNGSNYLISYYVSNVDFTPDYIFEGDTNYGDIWYVDVDYTPGSSVDAVDRPSSGGSGSGDSSAGFQLPDSWVNGGHTLNDPEPEDVGIDADAALEAIDELNFDAVKSDSLMAAQGVIWTLFSKTIEVFNFSPLLPVCLLLMLLAWFFGR